MSQFDQDFFSLNPMLASPTTDQNVPLSERMRPQSLDEIIGQNRSVGIHSHIGKLIRSGNLPNLIIWGPPGSGKTSLAQSIASVTKFHFISVNAIEVGSKQLKEIGDQGKLRRVQMQQGTILFIDEIHRLNKSQQDVLLPYLEKGDLRLIGATTENPSYELNRALLSRSTVIVFEKIQDRDLQSILDRSLKYLAIESKSLFASEDAVQFLISNSDGDARRLLNSLESIYALRAIDSENFPLDVEKISLVLQKSQIAYGKESDFKYDLISAFIKSIRGSDPDAALYYMVRMLEGGEDPLYIARRLVISASEDIGNAEPRALNLALAAFQAVEVLGLPEGEISLAQAVTYLAACPKSNRAYSALKKAKELVKNSPSYRVPLHLRSGKTDLCREQNYGRDYQYPHDFPKGFVAQQYLPNEIIETTFYEPSDRGLEKNLRDYLSWLKK